LEIYREILFYLCSFLQALHPSALKILDLNRAHL